MKRVAIFLIASFVSLITLGQTPLLESLWKTAPENLTLEPIEQKLSALIEAVDKKGTKDDFHYLHHLFQVTQKKILRSYSQYADIDEILRGRYDCLTATALFTALLDKKGFNFDIIETNYHIFLVVYTTHGDVLLETTDRHSGFVVDRQQIEERVGQYRQNLIASANSDKASYQYSFSLYREVSPHQLTGLLYFNQAVKAFNKGDLKLCADKLFLAKENYNTPRVAELAALLIQSLDYKKDLGAGEKNAILNRFREFKGYLGLPLASR